MTAVQYKAFVHYSDGRVRDRTRVASWSVDPTTYASIDDSGRLAVSEMLDLKQDVTLSARYTEASTSVETTKTVHMAVSVTLPQFVERNRLRAHEIQSQVMEELSQAVERETAILRALGPPALDTKPGHIDPYRTAVGRAITSGHDAMASTNKALELLLLLQQLPMPIP
jgi:hypothetical protein